MKAISILLTICLVLASGEAYHQWENGEWIYGIQLGSTSLVLGSKHANGYDQHEFTCIRNDKYPVPCLVSDYNLVISFKNLYVLRNE